MSEHATEYQARLSLSIVVPDGVYVPLARPLPARDRDELGDDDAIAIAEVAAYIREMLAGIEVQALDVDVRLGTTLTIHPTEEREPA